ncbi:hypothetical protein FF38_06621 [Lucilia cuprina]|uniref:Uncharacterized protein n=1 Tax=Lucilia cuprina TaxID=7375 RepID=A0A0L0CJ18_LUCCU|nr:hypothetical protein CVS40_6320 [Lucilia cuprina]KNC32255.1 hypothetical protein FF38_06621 [Lucilia cuprina]
MNLLTMLIPLLCITALSLLHTTNANPAFEGYRYEKPSIPFEYPTVTKKLPKNTDIKPTTTAIASTTKVPNEKLNTKSKPNSSTAIKTTTIATTLNKHQQQQKQEKSHATEKIKKSTVINPTAIKATNLNIKSNKNPETLTIITAESAATTVTVVKRKTDKLSLNQLPSNSTTSIHMATTGCTLYKAEEQKNVQNKLEKEFIKKTDPKVSAAQEAALENLLNRDNGYIYRLPSKEQQLKSLDENLPHTVHEDNHATKRLKLKNDVYEVDHSVGMNSLKYCCDQSFDILREKYRELAKNRPLERRLAPYTEKLADKEYFE